MFFLPIRLGSIILLGCYEDEPWLGPRLVQVPAVTLLRTFKRIFDRPDYAGCAIQEGARSVVDYAVEFGTLPAESGWNEPELLCAFRRGLNVSVHATLVGALPKDLAEMVDQAIEMDKQQKERRRERASSTIPWHFPA